MPDADRTYRSRAHAKLNLALVVGRAVDDPGSPTHGYHPIRSYMHAIELHDTVEIERLAMGGRFGPESEYDIAWRRKDGSRRPVGWSISTDLAARAHRAAEAAAGRPLPVRITITKSIPAGGGLGGGSSDAAAVLTGLDTLFGLGLGESGLHTLGATLGSDVAFFLDDGRAVPRPAMVESLGERIERLPTAHAGSVVTLIVPPFGCATGAVYAAFDRLNGADPGRGLDARRVRRVAQTLDPGALFNDLAPAAIEAEPRLGEIIERVSAALGKGVHVTGSGSTLFVPGEIDAGLVGRTAPGCRVVVTRLC